MRESVSADPLMQRDAVETEGKPPARLFIF